MKTIIAIALVSALAALLTQADSRWDGTWKLDRAKSHLTGQTLTISTTANGKWRYSDGTVSFDFALDGKPVKTFADGTMAFTADGDHAWNVVSRSSGSESHMHLVLSSDGKRLTDHTTGMRPDGRKTVEDGVMERVGEGSGFAGTWKSTKSESNTGASFGLVVAGDHIKWSWPAYKRYLEGEMDGSEIHLAGPTATPGMVFTIRKAAPTKITYVVKGEGKSLAEGVLELSADGKTLTDTEWAPAKPDEKSVAVYTK